MMGIDNCLRSKGIDNDASIKDGWICRLKTKVMDMHTSFLKTITKVDGSTMNMHGRYNGGVLHKEPPWPCAVLLHRSVAGATAPPTIH